MGKRALFEALQNITIQDLHVGQFLLVLAAELAQVLQQTSLLLVSMELQVLFSLSSFLPKICLTVLLLLLQENELWMWCQLHLQRDEAVLQSLVPS